MNDSGLGFIKKNAAVNSTFVPAIGITTRTVTGKVAVTFSTYY